MYITLPVSVILNITLPVSVILYITLPVSVILNITLLVSVILNITLPVSVILNITLPVSVILYIRSIVVGALFCTVYCTFGVLLLVHYFVRYVVHSAYYLQLRPRPKTPTL